MKKIILILIISSLSLFSQVNESTNYYLYSSFPTAYTKVDGNTLDLISSIGNADTSISSSNYSILPRITSYVTPIANINRGSNKTDSLRKTQHNIGNFGDGEEFTLNAYGANNYLWSTGETTQSIKVKVSQASTIWLETSTQSNQNNAIKSVRDSIQYSVSKLIISGIVKDINSIVLDNITVKLNGSLNDSTITNSKGDYLFPVVAGTYSLSVSHPDYTFTGPNQANPRVITNSSSTIGNDFIGEKIRFNVSGLVNEIGKGNLDGVKINISNGTFTTTSGGVYSIKLNKGSYTFTPELLNYRFFPVDTVINITNSDVLNVNFSAESLGATYVLSGKVSNTFDGSPIDNVTITAQIGTSKITETTNSTGGYSMNLPNGSYTLNASKSSWDFVNIPRNFTIASANKVENISGYIIPNAIVTGRVMTDSLNDKSGLKDIRVIFSNSSTLTDTQGYFSISLKKDVYNAIPNFTNYYFEPGFKPVKLEKDTNIGIFIAKTQSNGPSCIRMKDTVIPSVYVFPPYRASRARPLVFENNCDNDIIITRIDLEAGKDQFQIEDIATNINIFVPKLKEIPINIRFIPKKVGRDSIRVTVNYKVVNTNISNFTSAIAFANADTCDDNCSYTSLKLISIPDSAKPGEKVNLYLIAKPYKAQLTNGDKFSFKIKYRKQLMANLKCFSEDGTENKNAFTPGLEKDNVDLDPDGFVESNLTRDFKYLSANKDTLVRFNFIATLGQRDSTELIIQQFEWTSGNIRAEFIEKGIFRIIPCEAGGERMITWKKTNTIQLMSISPNPASDNLTLKINSTDELENSELEVFNVLGISLMKENNFTINKGDSEIILDLKDIPSGFYTIRLNSKPPQSPLEQVGGNVQSVFFKE